jgi:hypothetical protein
MKQVSMAEREQLRGLLAAKLRISEQNTKGKHVFLCVFERKYLLAKRKVTNSFSNIVRFPSGISLSPYLLALFL